MDNYDPLQLEAKWQTTWQKNQQFKALEDPTKEKFYGLVEFPYPSGDGLHVGHPRSYTAMDIISHFKRYCGYSVLYPIGFDSFGLPAENFAIKKGVHPAIITQKNIVNFTKQLKSLGMSFDWERSFSTTDPAYYKWTQWIFVQMYKKGLAYKSKQTINWCPACKIGLANEEVVSGACERCGGKVIKKEKSQWMLKITKYADRLIDDLDQTEYLEKIKTQQKNWIGRSEGAEINFEIKNSVEKLSVFTTRPDTIYGATYMVISPEHKLIDLLSDKIENLEEVKKYINQAAKKSDLERTDLAKDKTGFELKGISAINPATKKEIPVWIADYVLASYGTGAIMAVPAHDERDFEFAKKFSLNIINVVLPSSPGGVTGYVSPETYILGAKTYSESVKRNKQQGIDVYGEIKNSERCYFGKGQLVNSGKFDGLDSDEAGEKIINKFGFVKKKNYKLRDWVFSRQRYWGEPIPMIYCSKCGWQPVPEKDLPVLLPEVEKYEPTDDGESPLSKVKDWVKTTCPKCHGKAKRETDVMPNWAGSNWYFLRYCDPKNNQELADKKKLAYWGPVDWYNGGMEHTTLHLLYSRFVYKFLYDIKVVPKKWGIEPYKKRTSHGMILGKGGIKMSKSKGNVINPDKIVAEYGADTFRLYEMFMGPFDQAIPWDAQGIVGVKRFLDKVWECANYVSELESEDVTRELHKTIKKATGDLLKMGFNTVVAQFMIFINLVNKEKSISQDSWQKFLIILSPFAPHISEELYKKMGNKDSIFNNSWPEYDEKLVKESEVKIAIQVNGKVRATLLLPANSSEATVLEAAQADSNISRYLEAQEIKKTIYIQDRLLNIVV